MIEEERQPVAPAALAEAKAFLRVDGGGEDVVIGGLIAAACALCEAFIGQVVVARGFTEMLAASGGWTRLGRTPVLSVTEVAEAGVGAAVEAYGLDIDADGDGWVRRDGAFAAAPYASDLRARGELRVAYRAGMAAEWGAAPEALRQGIVRLAAHLYAHREGAGGDMAGGEPPAAVAALWRPYRRMPFARARAREFRR